MSTTIIERFADVAAWIARDLDGTTSTELTIAAGGRPRGPWRSSPTAIVTATTAAAGHRLDRTGPAVDLRPFTDLVLWIRVDRRADGSAEHPFYLEIQLGSPDQTPGAAGNTWHRLVEMTTPGQWVQVPLGLGDLPPGVRQSMTTLRLTCIDADEAWTMELDQIVAVRDELLVDTDAALRARLHEQLTLAGEPVPAVLFPVATPPPPPYLRLANYDVRPNLARSPGNQRRTDFTRSGFSLRPPAEPFDLYYTVDAVADDRTEAAALLDFAVGRLVPTTSLEVGARVVTVDWVDPGLLTAGTCTLDGTPERAGAFDRPAVNIRVSGVSRPVATAEPAVPVRTLTVEVEPHA